MNEEQLRAMVVRHNRLALIWGIAIGLGSLLLWLVTDPTFDGTVFRGKVANDPLHLTNLARGQSVTVKTSDMSDWMVVDDKRIRSGYTVRILRNRMTAAERQNFDRSIRSGMDGIGSGE